MEKTRSPAPEDEIAARFDAWAEALASGDPDRIADLYAEDAVLIPTVSNVVRRDRAAIVNYFTRFMRKLPEVRIHSRSIRVHDGIAMASGVYLFRLTREAGAAEVPARFTFIYRKGSDGWKIVEHHSSFMPEHGAF